MAYDPGRLSILIPAVERSLYNGETKYELPEIQAIYESMESYCWPNVRQHHPEPEVAGLWLRALMAYQTALLPYGEEGCEVIASMDLHADKFEPADNQSQIMYALLLTNYSLANCLLKRVPSGFAVREALRWFRAIKDRRLNKWQATMECTLAYSFYKENPSYNLCEEPAREALRIFRQLPSSEPPREGLLLIARYLSGERNIEVCTSAGEPKGRFSVQDMFFYHS